MHGADSKVTVVHLFGEPVDLTAGVAKDDGLCNGERLVEIAESVELVLLTFNGDVELLDTCEVVGVMFTKVEKGLAEYKSKKNKSK